MNLGAGDQPPSVLLSQLEKDQTRGGRDQREMGFQKAEDGTVNKHWACHPFNTRICSHSTVYRHPIRAGRANTCANAIRLHPVPNQPVWSYCDHP